MLSDEVLDLLQKDSVARDAGLVDVVRSIGLRSGAPKWWREVGHDDGFPNDKHANAAVEALGGDHGAVARTDYFDLVDMHLKKLDPVSDRGNNTRFSLRAAPKACVVGLRHAADSNVVLSCSSSCSRWQLIATFYVCHPQGALVTNREPHTRIQAPHNKAAGDHNMSMCRALGILCYTEAQDHVGRDALSWERCWTFEVESDQQSPIHWTTHIANVAGHTTMLEPDVTDDTQKSQPNTMNSGL